MSDAGPQPPYIDSQRVRRGFDRAATEFDRADFIHREVRERLLERLELISLEPERGLDLGAGTMAAVADLRRRFPNAHLVAADSSAAMLGAGRAHHDSANPVCASAQRLPFGTGVFDLVFSNLMLHYLADLPGVVAEIRRVMNFPGLFCFTTFGPDTLIELRRAFRQADQFTHVLPFMDMHDLGDLLVASGFTEPVVDRENLTVTYRSAEALFTDLRAAGSINATAKRNQGLTGRKGWRQMCRVLESSADSDGRFPVTLELIYGEAWSTPGGTGPAGRLGIPVEIAGPRQSS